MSLRRLFEVYRTDLRFQVKRPLVWVLVLIVFGFAWLLSTGHLHVSSGDSDVGGKKAWITSMFQQATFTGIIIAWFIFFSLGRSMLAIPDDWHADTIWERTLLEFMEVE